MSSLVKFTPLCGARSEQPLCYLLEIDEACILLDCGWDETFDLALLRRLLKIAPSIDAVLISHGDLQHLGALPYIFSKGNMKAKVYATLPVQKFGKLAMYDVLQSRSEREDFSLFTFGDIDNVFDDVANFVALRPEQEFVLSGKALEGITVRPHNAGHQIGGALWTIRKESEHIVYAVDYNHAQDRHLDGTVLENVQRPSILITDAYTAFDKPLGRKARENALLERVRLTVEQGGNVLLPVDSTGRVLELLIVLDECWRDNNVRNVTLAFVSPNSDSTIDMAKSHSEWLSKDINKRFSKHIEKVFTLENVHKCNNLSDLRDKPYPQVVLASGLDLETSSFALDLFAQWVSGPNNQVIFTQKPRPGSVARRLFDAVSTNRPLPMQSVVLQMYERVPLDSRELLELEEKQRQEKLEAQRKLEEEQEEEEEEEAVAEGGEGGALEASALPTVADMGDEGEGETAMAAPETPKAAAGTPRTPRSVGAGALFPAAKKQKIASKAPRRAEGRYLMFPHEEVFGLRFNEYGEDCDTSVFEKNQDVEAPDVVSETISYSGQTASEAPRPEPEAEKPKAEVPTKSICKVVKPQIRCGFSFVDFGGRSDGESVHTILEHLKPSKVIIIHGTDEATEALRNFCIRKVTEQDNALAPAVGEAVLASSDTNIYQIKLDSALAQSLEFVRIGGYDVAYMDAVIECHDASLESAKDKHLSSREMLRKQLPVLKQRQGNEGGAGGSKPFAFIGDVKLSDLKRLLDNAKYKTELKAGMLVVNGQIIISKSGSRNNWVFEGSICKEFHAVRKLLLTQYTTL